MPAPLAMPPIAYPVPRPRRPRCGRPRSARAKGDLGDGVGGADGVGGGEAAAAGGLGDAASTPGSSVSIGSRSPIRPVEQIAISPAESPSASASCSAVGWVSWKPNGPVQALAPPEFSTTARTRPPRSTCWVHSTGAALPGWR